MSEKYPCQYCLFLVTCKRSCLLLNRMQKHIRNNLKQETCPDCSYKIIRKQYSHIFTMVTYSCNYCGASFVLTAKKRFLRSDLKYLYIVSP